MNLTQLYEVSKKLTFFWSGLLCCSITVVGIKSKSSSIISLSLEYLLTTSNTSSRELLSVTNMLTALLRPGCWRQLPGHVSTLVTVVTPGMWSQQHRHCRMPTPPTKDEMLPCRSSTAFEMNQKQSKSKVKSYSSSIHIIRDFKQCIACHPK